MKKKRKRTRTVIVPAMGPATNIRTAGAHTSKRLYDRHKMKAIFRKEQEGFFS